MISLLCPTRGRPERFAGMVRSFEACTAGEFEVLCWLDRDDPRLQDYDRSVTAYCHISDHGRVGSSAMWNGLAKYARGDYLMMVNDDSVMCTDGWDSILARDTPKDGYCVAWPMSQGLQCTNPIISRRWYEALGYFIPPDYHWWYCDTALRDIAARAGRLLFLPEIQCAHMFPFAAMGFNGPDRGEMDETYKRNDRRDERDADRRRFIDTAEWREGEAKKLFAQILGAAGYSLRTVGE